ncbi:hypothetical protein E2493_14195 [Sphingomonas parva]|uniref:Uncharacterized protein n=1 Tax=Sphingomonas parva TaxID=2555898 RepID=A0A4Y8ZS92_9SPHN|nr:hypothetical protein [Sphingomonas parva]TFI57669.1 hypothetical protein E2493_14195 [Sphingomonas parva]
MSETERSYHANRARAEHDLARVAACKAVADAHAQLSLLHLARLKEVDELCEGTMLRGRR